MGQSRASCVRTPLPPGQFPHPLQPCSHWPTLRKDRRQQRCAPRHLVSGQPHAVVQADRDAHGSPPRDTGPAPCSFLGQCPKGGPNPSLCPKGGLSSSGGKGWQDLARIVRADPAPPCGSSPSYSLLHVLFCAPLCFQAPRGLVGTVGACAKRVANRTFTKFLQSAGGWCNSSPACLGLYLFAQGCSPS